MVLVKDNIHRVKIKLDLSSNTYLSFQLKLKIGTSLIQHTINWINNDGSKGDFSHTKFILSCSQTNRDFHLENPLKCSTFGACHHCRLGLWNSEDKVLFDSFRAHNGVKLFLKEHCTPFYFMRLPFSRNNS